MRADTPAGAPSAARRGRDATMLLGVSVATVAVWWWMVVRHGAAASAHDVLAPHATPLGVDAYPAVFAMWLVMSVAMMLPPVLPWLLVAAGASARDGQVRGVRRAGHYAPLGHAAVFAGGYFVLWTGYSAVAAGVQLWLQAVVAVDLGARGLDGVAGGAVLVVAGIGQLTPLKAACLAKCRTPVGFFLAHWRPSARAAVALGFRHGLHCLGCCWALMGVAFAVGVMNAWWMAALTATIVAEQTMPRGEVLARAVGSALLVWGALVMM